MSEPQCECERVRREIHSKPIGAPIHGCPLHPLTIPVPASPGSVTIALAASPDDDSLQLCFSEPTTVFSLPFDVARALGAKMIQAANLLDDPDPDEPPQRTQ